MKKQFGMIKRIAALLVAVLLVLTLASCGTGSASLEAGTHGALQYSYESKTLTITGSGAMNAFENADSVVWKSIRSAAEKVVIAEGVTSVGNYAFYEMSALKEVHLASTVTAIGNYAFAFCGSLETVSLPEGLTSVGEGAFEGCGKLSSVYLRSQVSSLGERAFAYCYSMTTVMSTGELSGIPSGAFKNCRSLETAIFHTSLTADKVAADAFEGASKTFADVTLTDSVNASTTVTVHYVYEDGTQASADFVYTWEYNVDYHIPSPEVAGYTADTLMVEGTANGTPREATVTYRVNTEAVDTSENEAEAPSEEDGVTPWTIVMIVIMVLILIGIGVGAFLLIRSDKKNAGKNTTTVRKNPDAKNGKKDRKKSKK